MAARASCNWKGGAAASIPINEVPTLNVSAVSTNRKRQKEGGIALLIAIFILLLIAVVAIALIVSSGTESALAGNYRSSTSVYYAATAGLEEVRARLRPSNPNSFNNTDPNFLPPPGTPLTSCAPIYLVNPLPGEAVAPWDPGNPYYDSEFSQEFTVAGCGAIPSPSPTANSFWLRNPLSGLPFPGPLYKWVRINGVSELSLYLDTSPYDTSVDPTLVYYDGTKLNDIAAGSQVLELTALAALPNGSQKIVQYLVAPTPLNLSFPSTLTLDGNNVQFSVPTSTTFQINGADQGTAGTCNPGPGTVTAVGYTNGGDASQTNIISAIPAGPPSSQDRRGNYTNGVAPTPNVGLVSVPTSLGCAGCNMTTAAGLNALVQVITENADVVINGNATQSSMPSAMSATNPMTVVINGNLTFNGWRNTGYGLLLVTGDFDYDPDASWDGIVMVIGTGKIYSHQGGTGQFLGTLFLANTAGGSPFFDFTTSSGSTGVYYSSCWIQAAMPKLPYKILSFHEVSQ